MKFNFVTIKIFFIIYLFISFYFLIYIHPQYMFFTLFLLYFFFFYSIPPHFFCSILFHMQAKQCIKQSLTSNFQNGVSYLNLHAIKRVQVVDLRL